MDGSPLCVWRNGWMDVQMQTQTPARGRTAPLAENLPSGEGNGRMDGWTYPSWYVSVSMRFVCVSRELTKCYLVSAGPSRCETTADRWTCCGWSVVSGVSCVMLRVLLGLASEGDGQGCAGGTFWPAGRDHLPRGASGRGAYSVRLQRQKALKTIPPHRAYARDHACLPCRQRTTIVSPVSVVCLCVFMAACLPVCRSARTIS